MDDDRVSWRHGVLRTDEHGWSFEDVGSMNGTFVRARRIRRAGIDGEIEFRLGSAEDGAQLACSVPPAMVRRTGVYRKPITTVKVGTRRLRIGRSPDNDLVVQDITVSKHHAELRNAGGGRYEIVDLGSHNGTFVNGERIPSSATVTEADILSIGRATFRLVGDELREFIDEGNVSLVAQDLTVRISGGQGPARPCELPDRGAQPGGGYRPERGGEVDPAGCPDRDAARHPG